MEKIKNISISCDGCVVRSLMSHEHSKNKKCCKKHKEGKRCKRCPKG